MLIALTGLSALMLLPLVLTWLFLSEYFPFILQYLAAETLAIVLLYKTRLVSAICVRVVRWLNKSQKTLVWGEVYDVVGRLVGIKEWKMMNHGYANDSQTGYTIELAESEEFERYSYQLYHYIGTGIREFPHFKHLDILEISCGRGGGLTFLCKYLHPATATGIDRDRRMIDFCMREYRDIQGVQFLVGEAEHLPRASNSADIVIDIGSSHCYSNFPKYLREVVRVLRPGGRFFFADFREVGDVPALETAIRNSNLNIDKKEDISEAVVRALKFDSLRRKRLISAHVLTPLVNAMNEFAGVEDSVFYARLKRGDVRYMAYKMMKDG